ncbi:esterase-like activity of phytase family protein [Caulobacter sp. 17J80-11]|uniref:esterase-like activity of phytase family protein n=1 Tax=Caulobacter sp. 17J80-11 TaxID=2763502 RepID=UPI0016534DAB|nr:esterase-like activity of phytase family protein [Caulobacter sp. 17J80-11]MBC6980396.1 esterase-like activity of phytase family protein [Caulobacter sp. 17J80-11]
MRSALAVLAALAALSACAAPERHSEPAAGQPEPRWAAVRVTATPVPLGIEAPAGLRYAGGIALASPDTSRLHGLSDLRIGTDGRLMAVSDDGDLFEAKLAFDTQGRLVGLTDARLKPLTGETGAALQGKAEGDAEGLAVLADGRTLVSFERDHRVLVYPAGGGRPVRGPIPDVRMGENEGLEALAAWPAKGADAYLAGVEDGRTFVCRLSGACAPVDLGSAPGGFGLVAADMEGPEPLLLYRAWDPVRGSRIRLKAGGRELLALERPASVDNFEAMSAVRSEAGTRVYLLSDDNFSDGQRTLLLAFDWVQ